MRPISGFLRNSLLHKELPTLKNTLINALWALISVSLRTISECGEFPGGMFMKTKVMHFRFRDKLASACSYIFLGICVCIALFPIFWVIMSSFKTNAEILNSGISLPSEFSFDGYRQALKISPILKFIFNSLIITSFSTVVNLFILSMAGYVFGRVKFKRKEILYFILCISIVIPMTALLHPVYLVIHSMHLANTKAGLILVYTALNLPMSLIILRGTFMAIPASIEEAAYIDGAGFARIFFQVMLPAAKGGLISAGILTFVNSWNEFTFALMLTSSENVRTLPLSLSYFTSQFSFNYTAMFAAITIAIIPSIAVFSIFQDRVITSITATLKE